MCRMVAAVDLESKTLHRHPTYFEHRATAFESADCQMSRPGRDVAESDLTVLRRLRSKRLHR